MLASRPPHRRILSIHQRLSRGEAPTLISLSEDLEVSERTVKRDLEFMRDQFGAPIEWIRERRGYVYTRPFDTLPTVRLSAEEAVTVLLANKVFAAWSESSLGAAFGAALRKLSDSIDDIVSISSDEIDELVLSPPEDAGRHREGELLGALIDAARQRRGIRIRYRKPHEAAAERRLWPMHLARLQGDWTLIAHDRDREDIRKFLLSRIEALDVLDMTFERMRDFDPESYLAGSLGRHTGENEYAVVIDFDSFAAPYVREEHWRPERTIEEYSDGGIRVNMTLNNLIDIRRYVLSWGRHARVVGPAELEESVREEVEAMWRNGGAE